MQKWEYLEAGIDFSSGREHPWQDSNGRQLKLTKITIAKGGIFTADTVFTTVAPICNELGADGWELTGISSGDPAYTCRPFFKRPLPD